MTEAPSFLRGPALAKWGELAPLNPTKLDQVAAFCAAYGRWVAAEEWLADPEHGPTMTIRDDKGNVKSHGISPQVGIAERSQKEMARLGRGLRKPGVA